MSAEKENNINAADEISTEEISEELNDEVKLRIKATDKLSIKRDANTKNEECEENSGEVCEIIDIKIVPYRFLKPETSEKVLNEIFELDGIIRGIVHGPSLPKTVYYGPARGTPVNHQYRKKINVKGQDIDLRLLIGEIILTVNVKLLNDIMESIEKILDETLSFKYILIIGIFTKTQITVSDYLKYGTNFENVIDERYIGMVDSRTRSSETIKMI
ncbi:methyl-coenzyme M reductase operon protein D [uncultured Methanobrevibacter sp.]|uniref:methyl-coenzyme M reductase operon protein D n=1 Tax=uncultured Methanobrevibacter sp. TaxID=253161 RepID=UPI00345A3C5B